MIHVERYISFVYYCDIFEMTERRKLTHYNDSLFSINIECTQYYCTVFLLVVYRGKAVLSYSPAKGGGKCPLYYTIHQRVLINTFELININNELAMFNTRFFLVRDSSKST